MSLRSKLSRLDAAGPALRGPPASPPPAEAPAPPERARVLDDLRARIQATLERTAPRPAPPASAEGPDLPFAAEQTPSGALHVYARRLSAAHRVGRAPLSAGLDASPELLALLALDPPLAACDLGGALFLDTETTGLSGGAGTVAFLVGLGFWDGRSLVVEQLLVRSLGEEAPMLERVAERVRSASMLVTFNGKSFDLPLLRTRFVLARVPPPAEPPHLDLLHVARRVHPKDGPARRLVGLERDVLGFERAGDVDSGDVGACYLHFLRTGDAGALLRVVEHNAWDVAALPALLGLYGEPQHAGLAPPDLVGVARTLRRAGALDRALAAADAAVRGDGGGPRALRARADIAKACGRRESALRDFEAIAETVDDPSVRLELAKAYEHWTKQPGRALDCVARGTSEGAEGARKRAERLARKAERLRARTIPLSFAAGAPTRRGS